MAIEQKCDIATLHGGRDRFDAGDLLPFVAIGEPQQNRGHVGRG
jgi:hypothetical protein